MVLKDRRLNKFKIADVVERVKHILNEELLRHEEADCEVGAATAM